MKFQSPSMHGSYERTDVRMDARTDGKPETNIPRQRLRNWGGGGIITALSGRAFH